MSSTLVTKQPVKQTGFRKGFTTVSHNQTLELTIEKYQELQRIIYIIFTVQKSLRLGVTHKYMRRAWKSKDWMYEKTIQSIYSNKYRKDKTRVHWPVFFY